jgi:hypothetical protein
MDDASPAVSFGFSSSEKRNPRETCDDKRQLFEDLLRIDIALSPRVAAEDLNRRFLTHRTGCPVRA